MAEFTCQDIIFYEKSFPFSHKNDQTNPVLYQEFLNRSGLVILIIQLPQTRNKTDESFTETPETNNLVSQPVQINITQNSPPSHTSHTLILESSHSLLSFLSHTVNPNMSIPCEPIQIAYDLAIPHAITRTYRRKDKQVDNAHSTITRAKDGIHKPKVWNMEVIEELEPNSLEEALLSPKQK